MKRKALLGVMTALAVGSALAFPVDWFIGANGNLLVIDGSVTTLASFSPLYEMHWIHLGEDWTYSETNGFSRFTHVGTGGHLSEAGKVRGITSLDDDSALSYNDYMVALYEKATGKYYFVSETVGGNGIQPYTLPEISDDPFMNGPPLISEEELEYYPSSSSGYFYKGAEIPPFCVWLAKHDLVQADLAGLDADLVNQAFAVGANPTNFTSVSLAVGDVSFGANSITGGLSLVARDGAQNATAVTRLNGGAALSLLSSTTLGGVTSALPASFNLVGGTFESTAGATNATQFLRLKLAVPDVW